MDDTDADEFEDGSDWDHVDSDDTQTLSRDYVFYLLIELEGALRRSLPGLSQEDAAKVGERLRRLAANMV